MSKAGLYNYPGRIRTYSGLFVDPLNMTADDIVIEDIAHALSNIPRFAGHTRKFLSVAQHSLWVANQLPEHLRIAGLLHDAAEAYLLDIPSPLKAQLPVYGIAEHRLLTQVSIKWKANVFAYEVKHADKMALEYEWANGVLADAMPFYEPFTAKVMFLDAFRRWVG